MITGNASKIIREALALKLLCRPTWDGSGYLYGSAYEVTPLGFYLWTPKERRQISITPTEATMLWELVTKEMVEAEHIKNLEEPF